MKESCRQFLNEQFDGDAEVMEAIYAEYTESIRAKLAEAEQAFANRDWTALDVVAHTIKGNALVAGDNETAEAAIALRSAAKLNEEAQVQELCGRLRQLAGAL